MSIKLNERYPGRFNNPSADYPGGSFKNRTTPVAKDGSYLEQDWANDKEGFFQSLLSKAGVLANGLIDKVGASQYFDALIQTRQSQTGVAFTSAGVSPALTLTPSPAITAYSANQRFRVKFAVASTNLDTLNVSGIGAKTLKQYDSTGAKVAAVFAINQLSDVEYDGVDFVVLNPLLRVSQATEAVIGGGKIAPQAYLTTGTDDATIVTPKKLRFGFSALFASAGYVTFPTWMGGFMIQWGSAPNATADGTQAVSYPTSFATQVFGMWGNLTTSTLAANNVGVYCQSTSLAGGNVSRDVSGSPYTAGPIFWVAIGN